MIIAGRVAWMKQHPTTAAATISAREALRRTADDYDKRAGEAGDQGAAAMLRAQAMMARDPVLLERAETLEAQGTPPDEAITAAANSFGTANPELRDVVNRALARSRGHVPAKPPRPGYPHVLVAQSLSAADLLEIDRRQVIGIITVEGGPTSHAAILARSLEIPAIIGYPQASTLREGEFITIEVPIPQAEKPTVSRRVPLLANVSSLQDTNLAVTVGAEGIGLLRTEFAFPSLDYAAMVAPFQSVVIRALDLGDRDGNPLGVRGLRYLRAHPDLLDAQLSAIVSLPGRQVSVMAPMVSTVDDARWFESRARSHGLTHIGAMIEVPAAALCAAEILEVVDFVSIGTNDLTQFTLAASRDDASLASYQDASHPAVLRLIEMVVTAGKRCGKPVSVCGEAAADPAFASVLIGLGVSSLSVAPSAIPAISALLR